MDLFEVCEQVIGFALFQFFEGIDAGGDRNDLGTDGAGTGDVARGIADDPDGRLRQQFGSVPQLNLSDRFMGDIVTVRVMISVSTKFEKVVQIVMRQFLMRALLEISGQ